MDRVKKAVKYLGETLCVLGCLWFLLPILHGGFALGAAFGFCICVLGLVLLCFYPKLAQKGGWRRVLARLATVLYGLGLLWASFLTVVMFTAQFRTPPDNVNVIVLGSQVYSAERMGVSLTNRINAAFAYLTENPRAKCIVTGGQGGDEPCPEALTEKNALVRMGIDEDRIYMEDKSSNTRENLEFAKAVADENGLGVKFAVVTQSFHMYRALGLAENAGFTAYSLKAETDWVIFPEYYGRELLSLTKYYVERLVLP